MSATFMEETPVGGLPIITRSIRKYLPQNKTKLRFIYRLQMMIFTYFVYALFNMARRPIFVIKSKIIEECNDTFNESVLNKTWCEEILHVGVSEILGLMDFLYIFSYGICLYASGIVADCYNPRFYLTAGCFLSGYFCTLLGFADYWNLRSFKFLGTVLILFGASESTAWPVVLSSVTHWYGMIGQKRRGLFFGFWNTHNYLGSIVGILIASIWADSDWMWSFFVPGFILILFGFLVFSYMVVDPKDLKQLDKEESKNLGRRTSSLSKEIPQWLSTNTSITMYEALSIPGVAEFSICMFFSRMVGYTFLFWLPIYLQIKEGMTTTTTTYYLLAYVVGGSIGGILAGILVDLFHRSAIVCATFLVVSIPIILVGDIPTFGDRMADFPLFLFIGLFVEAPYVIISTSVSAELSTHKLVKRNHRALSTIAGIIEGTGAIGASIGSYAGGVMLIQYHWINVLYFMASCQFVAMLLLGRQVYKEFYREEKLQTMSDYLKLPTFSIGK